MDKQIEQNGNSGDFEYLSEGGFAKLKKELEHLRVAKRTEIAKSLEYARSLGDLSENSEYQEAKSAQESNEARIAELEDILGRAVLIKKTSSKTADLGTIVTVERQESGNHEEYTIVGSEEADPGNRKISNESPLGRAFLGRGAGEIVEVHAPSGIILYKIHKIG